MKRFIKSLLPVGVGLAMLMAAIAAAPSPAWGQGPSGIEIIGFSKSGKYLAVARETGSTPFVSNGYWIITARFLNVPKNSFVSRKFTLDADQPDFKGLPVDAYDEINDNAWNDLREEVLIEAETVMNRFKIVEGNKGYSPEWSGARSVKSNTKASFKTRKGVKYSLALDVRDSPGGRKCKKSEPTKIFTLTLINKNGERKVLQKDRKLYGSRKCPFKYELEKIHLYRNFIVVIIQSTIPSGNNSVSRSLIVTGTLN